MCTLTYLSVSSPSINTSIDLESYMHSWKMFDWMAGEGQGRMAGWLVRWLDGWWADCWDG